jgi:hypothetical protein
MVGENDGEKDEFSMFRNRDLKADMEICQKAHQAINHLVPLNQYMICMNLPEDLHIDQLQELVRLNEIKEE